MCGSIECAYGAFAPRAAACSAFLNVAEQVIVHCALFVSWISSGDRSIGCGGWQSASGLYTSASSGVPTEFDRTALAYCLIDGRMACQPVLSTGKNCRSCRGA